MAPVRERTPIKKWNTTVNEGLITINFERTILFNSSNFPIVFDLNNCNYVVIASGTVNQGRIQPHSMNSLPKFSNDCFKLASNGKEAANLPQIIILPTATQITKTTTTLITTKASSTNQNSQKGIYNYFGLIALVRNRYSRENFFVYTLIEYLTLSKSLIFNTKVRNTFFSFFGIKYLKTLLIKILKRTYYLFIFS